MILGSWTTLLIIIFNSSPLSEILRGAPGCGWFMVKWCSFHFRIMAPTVLTGTFRSIEILLPSVSFATIRLRRSWESSLLLPIMKCFLCDTLVMRHLFLGHQLGLNQLILISTDKGQDCFLITYRFQLVSWLSMPFCTSLSSCVQYFFPMSFHFITQNLISELICFAFLYVWITWIVTSIDSQHTSVPWWFSGIPPPP